MPATNSGVHFAAYGVMAGVGLLLRRAPSPPFKTGGDEEISCALRSRGS
jgi:hypothetical protein